MDRELQEADAISMEVQIISSEMATWVLGRAKVNYHEKKVLSGFREWG